ncbi:MAG: TonB-dependent receptor [Pseudomonadota bacterium]
MKTHRMAVLATSTILAAQPALAQDALDLGTLILSGGLTPIEEERYGRSATVITSDDFKERGINSVQDALRAVPGVSVSSAGGNFTQVRIRGGESNHTLILIDGVEAAGGDGEYILSGLSTANIERIEVLRGPQSVFYGSNASAGVINIVTRTGGIGQEYGMSLEVGSHGSANASLFVSSRNDRGGLSLSLSNDQDAGWDFSGDGGERDKTDRFTAILKGDYRVSDQIELGFNLRHSQENFDFDSLNFAATNAATYVVDDPTQVSNREEMTFSIYGEHTFASGRVSQRLTYELTDNDQSTGAVAPTTTETEVLRYLLSVGLDGDLTAANHLINTLLEFEEDRSSTNPLFNRETQSIALEYRGSFGSGFDVQAGVRFDDNSVFDDAVVWNVGGSYTFANNVRIHASAGTAVVNPTYFELFANTPNGFFGPGTDGNPNLSPEENRGFDIGVEVPFFGDRGLIDVTYFNEELEDEITFTPGIGAGGRNGFVNQTGTSTREGFEVEAEFAATDSVDLRLFYTYLDAKNPNGTVEVRRPEHEVSLGITSQAFRGRGSVSADIRYVAGNADSRFFPPFGTAETPDFVTVDVAARYGVTENVDVTFGVDNLFDERYSEVWGYASRDQTFYFGFDANW